MCVVCNIYPKNSAVCFVYIPSSGETHLNSISIHVYQKSQSPTFDRESRGKCGESVRDYAPPRYYHRRAFRPLKPTLKITSARLFLGGKTDAKLRRVAGIAADCRIPLEPEEGGGRRGASGLWIVALPGAPSVFSTISAKPTGLPALSSHWYSY